MAEETMISISRFSTPEITIDVPLDLRSANVFITFKQNGKKVLELSSFNPNVIVNADTIVIKLTQTNTSKFLPSKLEFEIEYIFPDGSRDNSNALKALVDDTFKDEILTYVSG